MSFILLRRLKLISEITVVSDTDYTFKSRQIKNFPLLTATGSRNFIMKIN